MYQTLPDLGFDTLKFISNSGLPDIWVKRPPPFLVWCGMAWHGNGVGWDLHRCDIRSFWFDANAVNDTSSLVVLSGHTVRSSWRVNNRDDASQSASHVYSTQIQRKRVYSSFSHSYGTKLHVRGRSLFRPHGQYDTGRSRLAELCARRSRAK